MQLVLSATCIHIYFFSFQIIKRKMTRQTFYPFVISLPSSLSLPLSSNKKNHEKNIFVFVLYIYINFLIRLPNHSILRLWNVRAPATTKDLCTLNESLTAFAAQLLCGKTIQQFFHTKVGLRRQSSSRLKSISQFICRRCLSYLPQS